VVAGIDLAQRASLAAEVVDLERKIRVAWVERGRMRLSYEMTFVDKEQTAPPSARGAISSPKPTKTRTKSVSDVRGIDLDREEQWGIHSAENNSHDRRQNLTTYVQDVQDWSGAPFDLFSVSCRN
jgi:hypothetical protein